MAEKTEFYPATEEIKEMAERLMAAHHHDGLDAKVYYGFRNKHTKSNGKPVGGYCRKQSDEQKSMHGYDYSITLAADIWSAANQRLREAILLHECCHIGEKYDEKTDESSFITNPHDLEEFAIVVEVYGLYRPEVEQIAAAIEKSKDQ